MGIDLDHCLRSDSTPEPWAQEVLDRFPSYAEVSPSKSGLKIILRGRWEGGWNRFDIKGHHGSRIEVYDRDRYFTVTGQRLPDAPRECVAPCGVRPGASGLAGHRQRYETTALSPKTTSNCCGESGRWWGTVPSSIACGRAT
jgi:hypothetical protein